MGNNQTFTKPHIGTCWSSVFAPMGPVKEPPPMFACLFVAALGLSGMLLSTRITEGGKFLYSAMFGYGISSCCFHWNLWEDFYRVLDVQLNFLQAINIVYMSCIPEEEHLCYKISSYLLIMFFSIYPFFAHVLGITLEQSWISWITFDGIWIFALIGLMIIWCLRDHLGTPGHPRRQAMFNLVWKTIISVILAYLFWILDEVVCVQHGNHSVAIVIFGHTLWHVFIGFGFYYMTTLIVFLRAQNLRVYPRVLAWPKCCIIFVVVQYEPNRYSDTLPPGRLDGGKIALGASLPSGESSRWRDDGRLPNLRLKETTPKKEH